MILKYLFNLFYKNKKKNRAPITTMEQIPWDDIINECYDKGLDFIYPVIKTIYTDDKTQRAIILRKPNGLFIVKYEQLFEFNDEELKYNSSGMHGFWSPMDYGTNSIYDTEKTAIREILSKPPYKYNKCIVWDDAL
ncbi:MAG: hypothetical protein AB9835_12790 [Eubacteriales bacterium]